MAENSTQPPHATRFVETTRGIAANVGRAKDKARIEQLLQQADLDKSYLAEVLQRHKLQLPTP